EARFDGVVKEDRVQGDARRRTQAKRDVRDAEQSEAARKLTFDSAYALDGFERVAAVFFDACRDGERERVEEDVRGREAEFGGRLLVGTLRNFKLAFGGARHSLLVNRADDDARAVLLGKSDNFPEARLAVLLVRRIEHALSARVLKARLHLLPFGRVEHERQADVR